MEQKYEQIKSYFNCYHYSYHYYSVPAGQGTLTRIDKHEQIKRIESQKGKQEQTPSQYDRSIPKLLLGYQKDIC